MREGEGWGMVGGWVAWGGGGGGASLLPMIEAD